MANDLKRRIVEILLRDENQVRIDRDEFDALYRILKSEDWITSIGDLEACSCLTQLLTDELNIDISDILQNLGHVPDGFAFGFQGLASIRIPDNVTSIGENAFCGCTALTDVIVPDSVTSIGDSSFYNCRNLKRISLKGVQDIPKFALSNTGVEEVTLCTELKSIRLNAFASCTSLKSIELPVTLKSIDEGAFYRMSINDINYNGASAQFKEIKKHRNWHEECPCSVVVHCTDKDLIYK